MLYQLLANSSSNFKLGGAKKKSWNHGEAYYPTNFTVLGRYHVLGFPCRPWCHLVVVRHRTCTDHILAGDMTLEGAVSVMNGYKTASNPFIIPLN